MPNKTLLHKKQNKIGDKVRTNFDTNKKRYATKARDKKFVRQKICTNKFGYSSTNYISNYSTKSSYTTQISQQLKIVVQTNFLFRQKSAGKVAVSIYCRRQKVWSGTGKK